MKTEQSLVFTYASGLETNSPRFTQPGDFFTYILFLATVTLVCILMLCSVSPP